MQRACLIDCRQVLTTTAREPRARSEMDTFGRVRCGIHQSTSRAINNFSASHLKTTRSVAHTHEVCHGSIAQIIAQKVHFLHDELADHMRPCTTAQGCFGDPLTRIAARAESTSSVALRDRHVCLCAAYRLGREATMALWMRKMNVRLSGARHTCDPRWVQSE